jgi:hypothetical protein
MLNPARFPAIEPPLSRQSAPHDAAHDDALDWGYEAAMPFLTDPSCLGDPASSAPPQLSWSGAGAG